MGICLGTENNPETTCNVKTIEILEKSEIKVDIIEPIPKW